MYRKTISSHTFFRFILFRFISCSYTLIYNNTSKQTPLPRTPSQPRKLSYAAPQTFLCSPTIFYLSFTNENTEIFQPQEPQKEKKKKISTESLFFK